MQKREKKTLLAVKDLKLHYKRGLFSRQIVRAVNGVSLAIGHGQTFGLIGESGSGKSTLARCILRLIKPTGGRILFEGNDISRMNGNLKSYRRKVQVIFQDADGALNPRMRAIDLVSEPLRIHGIPRDKAHKQALNLLGRVKLSPDLADSFPEELSGGQRQRIGIARALSLSPRLIIADEATASLDILNRVHIVNLLRQLQAESGISYLLISHDLNLIRRFADQVAVMHRGKFVEAGPVDRIFSAPAHTYTRELFSSNRILDPLSGLT